MQSPEIASGSASLPIYPRSWRRRRRRASVPHGAGPCRNRCVVPGSARSAAGRQSDAEQRRATAGTPALRSSSGRTTVQPRRSRQPPRRRRVGTPLGVGSEGGPRGGRGPGSFNVSSGYRSAPRSERRDRQCHSPLRSSARDLGGPGHDRRETQGNATLPHREGGPRPRRARRQQCTNRLAWRSRHRDRGENARRLGGEALPWRWRCENVCSNSLAPRCTTTRSPPC